MCSISMAPQKPQECILNVLFVKSLSSSANRHQEPAIVFVFTSLKNDRQIYQYSLLFKYYETILPNK